MRRKLLLLVLVWLLVLVAPAAADTPRGRLLSAVQAGRVEKVTATMGMLDNSRVWSEQAAQDVVLQAQQIEAESRSNDRIQPWTWDWVKNVPRTDVTPLAFSIAVKESWLVDGAPLAFSRYNVLACYDVGLIEIYHCRQYQGSDGDEYLSSHINSIVIERADGDALITALFTEETDPMIPALTQTDVITYLQWGGLALVALVLIALLGAVIALIGLGTAWARKQFLLADAALAPLGQTPIGSLAHGAVTELKSGVDETTDPYVTAVHNALQGVISGVVQAVLPQYIERAKTLVTPQQVQQFLLYMVTGLEELTDGEVATEADIPTASYGVPEPDAPVPLVPEQEHIPAGPSEATK